MFLCLLLTAMEVNILNVSPYEGQYRYAQSQFVLFSALSQLISEISKYKGSIDRIGLGIGLGIGFVLGTMKNTRRKLFRTSVS